MQIFTNITTQQPLSLYHIFKGFILIFTEKILFIERKVKYCKSFKLKFGNYKAVLVNRNLCFVLYDVYPASTCSEKYFPDYKQCLVIFLSYCSATILIYRNLIFHKSSYNFVHDISNFYSKLFNQTKRSHDQNNSEPHHFRLVFLLFVHENIFKVHTSDVQSKVRVQQFCRLQLSPVYDCFVG